MAELCHAGENKHFASENKVLMKSLHIAPAVHQLGDAQRWVHASNVFISNHLLPRNFAEFVAKLPDVRTCPLMVY